MLDDWSVYADANLRINNILVRERKKRKWTQRDFAKMIGRSQSFVARYERNETVLNILQLRTVTKALDYPLKLVLDELDSWSPPEKYKRKVVLDRKASDALALATGRLRRLKRVESGDMVPKPKITNKSDRKKEHLE